MNAGAVYYRPLDEELARPQLRVLRFLRHFEDASLVELLDAAREPSHKNHTAYQAFSRALLRHTEYGFVERIRSGGIYRYRITEAGRAELERRLSAAGLSEGDPIR